MRVRANLHFHSRDDPRHPGIRYSTREGIDRAADLGFGVLGLTCHRHFAYTAKLAAHACSRGVLLLPGIEVAVRGEGPSLRRSHVLILNCDPSAEAVHTLRDLRRYRRTHPGAFVIAPHPFYYGNMSLKGHLLANLDLFDAIEHCWFYSQRFDRNVRARRVAEEYGLPYIATSDAHFFDFFDQCYAVLSVEELSPRAVFQAIRERRFENVTRPRHAVRDLLWAFLGLTLRDALLLARRSLAGRLDGAPRAYPSNPPAAAP